MKRQLFLLVVLIIVVAAQPFMAFASPAAYYDFVRLNKAFGNKYEAVFNADGTARYIAAVRPEETNGKSLASRSSCEAAARRFIDSASKVLGNSASDGSLALERTFSSSGAYHFIFVPCYDGLPVHERSISVHVSRSGEVIGAGNSLPSVTGASRYGKLRISSETAVEAAMSFAGVEKTRGKTTAEKVIHASKDALVPAWRVTIPSLRPMADLVVVISGLDGSSLSLCDMLKSAYPLGSVYYSSPLNSKVTNEPLLYLTSTYKGLTGKYAAVGNEDADNAHDRIRPDANGNFIFDPKNTHFDEVCAYYFANRVHDHYNKLGFTLLDKPVGIIVHCNNNLDNAYYSPIFGYIEIDNCQRRNDLAQEEDIMFHEYSHAVTHQIVNLSGGEAGAMNEAFSDYFPASFTNDPHIGQWMVAKQNAPYLRTLTNKAHYPEDIKHEPHDDGQIYSGALWQLRSAIGAEACDLITHYSRNYLTGIRDQVFTDGLAAMLSADRELYGGAHAEAITREFASRGIYKAQPAPATEKELMSYLKFEALNGNKKAARLYLDIANGNAR